MSVIEFKPRADAPIQRAPKAPVFSPDLAALAGGLGDVLRVDPVRKSVDPSLDAALAGRMEALADHVRTVMRAAETARRFRDALWLRELADSLELRAAAIEAKHHAE